MRALHEVAEYQARRRRKKRWHSVVAGLAAIVVCCTTYALILPAITMGQEVFCGKEEHTHDDSCYATELVCGREFDEVQAEGHVHDESCYTYEEVLTCGEEESEDTYHEHTDACYDEEENLICDEPEWTPGHTHTEDCYGQEQVLTCEEEEQEAVFEPHRHTEACYERVFVCTKEEHTHMLSCYCDQSADLESAAVWEETIPELRGKTIGENIALVAKSQVGYTQSDRNYEVDDAGGKHGYTRYGAWYGYPYGEWCAMFASFCLHYAGVPQADFPYASGCVYWMETLEAEGLYKSAGSYAPKQGDLAFFDTDGDGVSDHVGVVTAVRGEKLETVEGNVAGAVTEKRHTLTEEALLGFGAVPAEEDVPDAPVIDNPDEKKPAGENPDEPAADEAPAHGDEPEEEEPEEDPDAEHPADEAPEDEKEPEPVCGLQAHEHTEDCYSARGELVCGLEEHVHTDTCYQTEEDGEESSYSEEELAQILEDFTQEAESFEALEELTDEDIQAAQELLTRLEQAHQDGQLSDEDFVALYERVQALFSDADGIVGEMGEPMNIMLLRDSGWFDEYSYAAYDSDDEESTVSLFTGSSEAVRYSEDAPSDQQVVKRGGTTTNDADGVSVSKTISGTELENVFDITLEVQTPQTISEVIEEPDMAVVIVMDISNTMTYAFGNTTRYQAAMEAAENFLDQFAESNQLGVSKIGYVAFNTNAQKIFGLQNCVNAQDANRLKNIMRTETGKVLDYADSHERFTNVEAGLKLGRDMLKDATNKNKYIIFLSDGFPTTYVSSGYNGYDPYCTSGTPGRDGVFYDSVTRKYCLYGTSYSDRAAIRAREMATKIKNDGIKIFSIGVDVGGQTIQTYVKQTVNKNFSVVDRTSETYEIGSPNSADAYKNWLRNGIGSGDYYDSTNLAGLEEAYNKIFEKIKEEVKIGSEADWVASDAMPEFQGVDAVEFIGLYDKSGEGYPQKLDGKAQDENDASYKADTDAISWDLKNSVYTTRTQGSTTIYIYTLKYRVRLQNEQEGFTERKEYVTNGKTTLRYRVIETANGVTKVSDPKELTFPVPSVEGYLGELTFTKRDNRGNALAGAEFTLRHADTCGLCRGDGEHSVTMDESQARWTAVSDENGTVSFENLPSGHTYTLTETGVPPGYAASGSSYLVTIAYDKVSVSVLDYSKQLSGTWSGDGSGISWDDGSGVIVNNTYYELPSTGGSGTMWFTVGGLGLMVLAGCGLYLIKRRRGKEDTASF